SRFKCNSATNRGLIGFPACLLKCNKVQHSATCNRVKQTVAEGKLHAVLGALPGDHKITVRSSGVRIAGLAVGKDGTRVHGRRRARSLNTSHDVKEHVPD